MMKANERLANWLAAKNREYKEGLQLFKELNIDVKKLPFFSVPEPGKIHMSLLLRHLENYARINGIKVGKQEPVQVIKTEPIRKGRREKLPSTEQPRIERPQIDSNPIVRKEELPEDLKLKFDENGRLNNEMKSYHAELKACADDPAKQERRGWLANKIVEYKNAMRDNWNAIDAWWNAKKGKTTEQQAAEDAIRQKNRIEANLNYIRRYFNTQKASQQAELERRKQELDQWGVSYEKLITKVAVSDQP